MSSESNIRYAATAATLVATLPTLFAGCAAALPSRPRPAPADDVWLIRGWSGLDRWSAGVDALAGELARAGVAATCVREESWRDVTAALLAKPSGRPVVLIGYSFGADDAVRVARQLADAGRPVGLLVTIDPVTPPPVPANVARATDYYESDPPWDALPWLRGVPLRVAEPATTALDNFDVRRNRRDLLQPGENHRTIAANAGVHREIVARIRAIFGKHVADPL